MNKLINTQTVRGVSLEHDLLSFAKLVTACDIGKFKWKENQ